MSRTLPSLGLDDQLDGGGPVSRRNFHLLALTHPLAIHIRHYFVLKVAVDVYRQTPLGVPLHNADVSVKPYVLLSGFEPSLGAAGA